MVDELDVDDVVALARARLRALHAAQHAVVNHRARDGVDPDLELKASLAPYVRDLFARDGTSERASAAATRMAFCGLETAGELRFWEYGVEWLATAERRLALYRVKCGGLDARRMLVEDGSGKGGDGFEWDSDGSTWMPFELATTATGRRVALEVRDGYAKVPKEALAECYAERVEREVRRDCERVFRKLRAWVSAGDAPRAFDPRCRSNALRAIRTWQPAVEDLPRVDARGGVSLAKRRRARRRAVRVGGAAQVAIAVEADDVGEDAEVHRSGEDLKRALAAAHPAATKVQTRPYPPCMRDQLSALRRDAHLKYADRFRLNLFLKGIGFEVGETLEFWRRGVFPRGRMAAYQKEHTYSIRHHYGLEGAMKDYTPHNCESLGKKSENGRACPFVGSNVDEFRSASSSKDWFGELSFDGRVAVELAVQAGDARCACERVFADFHGGVPVGEDFLFPVDYYDASLEIEELYRERKSALAKAPSNAENAAESGDDDQSEDDVLPKNFKLDVDEFSSDDDDK